MLTIPWLRPLSPMNNRIYPCNATPQRPHGFVFAHRWLLVLVTLFVLSVNELHVLAVSPRLLGAWSPATSMRTARVYHTAILLPTDRVLVMGGVAASGAILSGVEVYDPRTGRWATGAPMRSARAGVTAVLLPTGRVLVAGGASGTAGPGPVLRSAELYDLRTGRWTATGAMTTARYNRTPQGWRPSMDAAQGGPEASDEGVFLGRIRLLKGREYRLALDIGEGKRVRIRPWNEAHRRSHERPFPP